MNNKEKMLLIDGNYLMFQSFYATYRGDVNAIMHSSNGTPTNAINLFLLQIIKLIRFFNPEYLFIAFDASAKTQRHLTYPEYKANRTKAPKEIFVQFDIIKQLLSKLNIFHFEINGAEADDLIATASRRFNSDNLQKLIFSRDKDLLQLVNESTSIIDKDFQSSYQLITNENFYQIYNLYPSQIVDFKALKGDPSDNLPGIKGIGDKTAIKLLKQFHSFSGIYQNLDQLRGSLKDKLINNQAQGQMCYDLAQLNFNVAEFEINKDVLKLNIQIEPANSMLKELELNIVTRYLKELF
ncbi:MULTISPECIES: 5'-3' exonuclease H3TH domain-containing protein [unclassified Mycoplasma]|uniref:5'-3' exonuclease n=1 Tax=unclassified Mycoplasma TaxID=2683645 RepID=UPI00211BB41B|nr:MULTISPECIES: 5'-3' exonuclease H3TH domain-containing protein [unclassified Mycoplasma]UUM19583.1 DNA polymerase I [Mycoplasma sp. 1578d]UUM24502.1 DNA polymerase I [Mycoplasma sp. 3686d]